MFEDARLDELTKEEWLGILHRFRPDLTEEDFEPLWQEFQAYRQRKLLQ